MVAEQTTYYLWHTSTQNWESLGNSWEVNDFISYVPEIKNTLYSSGEYLILANSAPYEKVKIITGVEENLTDSGVGTILKKEFRYSIDSVTFSEFQELTTQALESLGSFDRIWFQFRYILLSGGPVTITSVSVAFTKDQSDPFQDTAPAIQDQSRVYAFPVIYKSNFLWEPYKMNRAIRLYKDLNLMVNSLFGHDTTYYRVLPQGRSKDVFLMEYSLYEHDEGRYVKVVVPNNEFPDNKLNMGPFGVDFELPFEVQIDKDYFQKIFGDGSGPQKRDVLYFPRTNRIYEVSSSYLYRDFMNEPLYFKVTLMKWLPKSNVEQSETLNNLEDYTASAGKLFGDIIEQEEVKITNPEQFNVAYVKNDPVRYSVYVDQEIGSEDILNYYTLVAEHYYKLDSTINHKKIRVNVDSTYLKEGEIYYVRFSPDSSQDDVQKYYSMKKLTYLGKDEENYSIFSYQPGNSQLQNLYTTAEIFFPGSEFFLYEKDYGETSESVASCDTTVANFYKPRVVKYKSIGEFPSNEDRAFSAWFNLKENISSKISVSSFTFDENINELTIVFEKNILLYEKDYISVTRKAGGDFCIIGEVKKVISKNQVVLKIDQELADYAKGNFSTWTSFTDLQGQKTFPRVFLNSMSNSKGIKIELFENRHFKVSMNSTQYFFSILGNSLPLENGKWHGIFINFSNVFKQLTLNCWKMQWDPVAKIPATTDLKLIYNKTVSMIPEDRTSNMNYFLEPSWMNLTNVRLFNRVAETDKQVLILNQNIVKDAQWAIIIDNALPQSKLPYIGYTR